MEKYDIRKFEWLSFEGLNDSQCTFLRLSKAQFSKGTSNVLFQLS